MAANTLKGTEWIMFQTMLVILNLLCINFWYKLNLDKCIACDVAKELTKRELLRPVNVDYTKM